MGVIAFFTQGSDSSGSWEVHFDNSDWSGLSSTTWTGSAWDSNNVEILITESGSWVEGYRPTKVRVTHNGPSTMTLKVTGAGGSPTYGEASNYVSGAEMALNCTADIQRLYITPSGAEDFLVTNIEFFVEN